MSGRQPTTLKHDGRPARGCASRVVATVAYLLLSGCACVGRQAPLHAYQFSVYHPRSAVVYRAQAGTPPADERIFIYLAIQNGSRPGAPLCFACWSKRKGEWKKRLGGELVPVVQVVNDGAPIIGSPEVRLQGISGKALRTGDRFPEVLPDAADFPLNEANFRRDFAIVVRPDRNTLQPSGRLHVNATLVRAGQSGTGSHAAQSVLFDIKIELRPNEFRPDMVTVDTSEPSQ